MLPEMPESNQLYAGPDQLPPPSPVASEHRDSGLGSLGIDTLDPVLDALDSQLPRLELEDDAGQASDR